MFLLLVAIAEVVGRALTTHVDRWLHVSPLAPSDASYYPFLLVGVKVAAALACAAVLARATRVLAAADSGGRLLHAVGHGHEHRAPRLRPGLSPRIWLGAFLTTSLLYLVHSDADGIVAGRWQMFAPWLHSYALPIFAVLAVVIAVLWRVASWLYDVEEYAERAIARVRHILNAAFRRETIHARPVDDSGPRRRFGLAFESRPPPLAA
jgi:hypothetical protein